MTDVPSVNPDKTEIPDSEGSNALWVDPIFTEDRLGDEPEPAPEKPGLDPDALKALLAEHKDEPAEGEDDGEDDDDAPAEGDDAEKAKAGDKPEDTDGDGTAPKEPDAGDRKPRTRSRARRERREMQRALRDLQRDLGTLKDVLAGRIEKPAPAAEAKPGATPEDGDGTTAAPEGPPKLEDFDFDTDQWATAMGEWTQKRIDAGKDEARKAEEAKARDAEHKRKVEVAKQFREREETARDKHDDYDDVVYDESIFIAPAAADLIAESDVGPEIAYYLATHQDEAKQMDGASDVAVARMIGRIEARLQAEQAPKAKPAAEAGSEADATEPARTTAPPAKPAAAPRTATRAPAPIPTVGTGGGSATRDPSKMTNDEYRKWRASQPSG